MAPVSKVMAGCFAMAAFAVAIVAGLSGGNPATLILGRALIAMIICYPVGLVIGLICERVISSHVTEFEQQHPLPEDDEVSREADGSESSISEDEEEVLVV